MDKFVIDLDKVLDELEQIDNDEEDTTGKNVHFYVLNLRCCQTILNECLHLLIIWACVNKALR